MDNSSSPFFNTSFPAPHCWSQQQLQSWGYGSELEQLTYVTCCLHKLCKTDTKWGGHVYQSANVFSETTQWILIKILYWGSTPKDVQKIKTCYISIYKRSWTLLE
jgi:hypothetical protein